MEQIPRETPQDERKRKRRARLLALLTTLLFLFMLLMLVFPSRVPEIESTGYLVVNLGPGAENVGEEAYAGSEEPDGPIGPNELGLPDAVAEPVPQPVQETGAVPPPPVVEPVEEAPPPEPVAETPAEPGTEPVPEPIEEPLPEPIETESEPIEAPPEPTPMAAVQPPEPSPAPQELTPVRPPTPSPAENQPSEREPVAEPSPSPSEMAAVSPPLPSAPVETAESRPGQGDPSGAEAGGTASAAVTTSPQAGNEYGAAFGIGNRPDTIERLRPLMVSLDNATGGYPQAGLNSAATIYELPVEGGITRLFALFTGNEEGRIGPVRSARDYVLQLATDTGSLLVHVGGSPEFQDTVARQNIVTFDGLYDANLFKRDSARRAPHNVYVQSQQVRDRLQALRLERPHELSGRPYRAPANAAAGNSVTIQFWSQYTSGFRYQDDQYVWYRNGAVGTDDVGRPVKVYAVVVMQGGAQRIEGDDAGRIDLDLSGGPADVYIEGKKVSGTWRYGQGGFTVYDPAGQPMDLRAYRTWYYFVPPWGKISN